MLISLKRIVYYIRVTSLIVLKASLKFSVFRSIV